MRKFGLIGYPISGSSSPALFAEAYGGAFGYELIEDPSFDVCWQKFLEGYDGVNVTAPFKMKAAGRADIRSAECEEIGAANILVKTREGVKAYNSDYFAVQEILVNEKVTGKVLVVGNGGAGKAAACAARSLGLEVSVANRTPGPGLLPLEAVPALAQECGMVIYALPCLPEALKDLSCPLLLEANYKNPSFEDCGSIDRYIGGLRWLRGQARLGYSLLTGVNPVFSD